MLCLIGTAFVVEDSLDVARSVENADNFNATFGDPVEDEMFLKAGHAPHPQAYQPAVSELARSAHLGHGGKLLECGLRGLVKADLASRLSRPM
jgi:hypothetical protein